MQSTNPDNQLTLSELLGKSREVIYYLKLKWLTLLLAVLIGAVLGAGYALLKKNVYKAELSFVLADQSSGGGLSAYAGIASQFGIDLGGVGESSSLFQGDNILEFIKSRRMISETLLHPVNLNGKSELLANRYAEVAGFQQDWAKDAATQGFRFTTGQGRLQDSLIQVLYQRLIKKTLTVAKPDKKLNIIKVTTQSTDELFAKVFTERLIQRVMDFYVETKTKKEQDNLNILTRQVDSVRKELNKALGGVAAAADANPNPNRALQQLQVGSQRRRIEVQTNSAILEELVKNQELARISVRKEMPILQLIDQPILPLPNNAMGPFKAAILGALLFGFLTAGLLMVRVLLKSVN